MMTEQVHKSNLEQIKLDDLRKQIIEMLDRLPDKDFNEVYETLKGRGIL